MNGRGQGVLEYLLLIGAAVFVAGIVIVVIQTESPTNEYDALAEKFCMAWAEENDLIFVKGYYKEYFLYESDIVCSYSTEAETFNGVASTGSTKNKLFEISEKDLLELYHEEKEADCCEVCN